VYILTLVGVVYYMAPLNILISDLNVFYVNVLYFVLKLRKKAWYMSCISPDTPLLD